MQVDANSKDIHTLASTRKRNFEVTNTASVKRQHQRESQLEIHAHDNEGQAGKLCNRSCMFIPSESAPSSPEDTDTTRWLGRITRIDQQPYKTVHSNAVNHPTLPPGLIIRDLFREQQVLLDKEPEFGAY